MGKTLGELADIARAAWMECDLTGDHWAATAKAVRSKVIDDCIQTIVDLKGNSQQIKLHMGEISAQELRTLKSGFSLIEHKITALKDQRNA